MKRTGYLITAKNRGVFLGIVELPAPTGVWSLYGCHAWLPTCAPVFATAEGALWFADRFEPPPLGLKLVECTPDCVSPDGFMFASRDVCEALGMTPWLQPGDQTANRIPL